MYVDCIGYFQRELLPEAMMGTITKFSFKELKSYLNKFGQCLLGLSNDPIDQFRSKQYPQLYSGKIGSEDVLMVLDLNGLESIEGEYVYQKYGHGIFIDGRKVNDWIEMDEYDSSGKKSGKIEASIKGKEIKGSWRSADNTKIYPFFVNRK